VWRYRTDGWPQLFNTLQDLSNSRAKDEEALQAALAQADAAYVKLLSPAPDPSWQLQATRQALMALNEQLSVKERLALSASFAKTVRRALKDQKDEGSTP
jgi:predicted phage-related endonuclease